MAYEKEWVEVAQRRGEILRQRREELGLRLGQVAQAAGRSRSHLKELEKGRVYDPGISTISALARGYQMSVSRVLELYGIQLEDGYCNQPDHEHIRQAATNLFIPVWRELVAGHIPDRGPVDDAALNLRDALNPNWPHDPDWLPEELQD